MPNWVRNQVMITGAPEKVEALKKQVGAPTEVPGVESVRDSEGNYLRDGDGNFVYNNTTHTDQDPGFSLWNIIRPRPEEYDSYRNQGWYDWNCRTWGCKWDVSDLEIVDDSPGHWHISFDTPWSPPSEALTLLSAQHPEVRVHVEWTEEQGFGAEQVFEAGGVDTLREWDIPETHEQYEEVFGEESCPCCYAGDDVDSYPFTDCPRPENDTTLAVAELEKISELI